MVERIAIRANRLSGITLSPRHQMAVSHLTSNCNFVALPLSYFNENRGTTEPCLAIFSTSDFVRKEGIWIDFDVFVGKVDVDHATDTG